MHFWSSPWWHFDHRKVRSVAIKVDSEKIEHLSFRLVPFDRHRMMKPTLSNVLLVRRVFFRLLAQYIRSNIVNLKTLVGYEYAEYIVA